MGDFSGRRSSSLMSLRAKLDASSLISIWRGLHNIPGGRWLFSHLVGQMAPYSGSIRPVVTRLDSGHAWVELKDRRRVRNHLDSIHAIALANLGEVTSGLALISTLPSSQRGIVTVLSIEYFKKARGRLYAESSAHAPVVEDDKDAELDVFCDIRDGAGDVVARTTVHWRIGRKPGA